MAAASPLPDRLPQQLWFEVERPIHVRPDRQATARSPRRESAPAKPAQMELRMAPPSAVPPPILKPPAPSVSRPPVPTIVETPMPLSFAAWLLDQSGRKGVVGDLAKAARLDRQFPRKGSADDVRARFSAAGADGDAFEALDDVEREYDRSLT